MFKWIYNIFVPLTPTKRAKIDIAELERDLYEARIARAIARQGYENKGLRINQIEKQIEELRLEYPAEEKESKTVHFINDIPAQRETVRSVIENESKASRRFGTGGFVGKDRQS